MQFRFDKPHNNPYEVQRLGVTNVIKDNHEVHTQDENFEWDDFTAEDLASRGL
jgi:hypothetical protein